MNKLSFKMRILLVSSFSFFLFALLVGQFFRIQILEGDKWRNYAGRQHYIDVVEPFVRGTFYSNTSIKKGHPEIIQKFAFDISKFHLYIDDHGPTWTFCASRAYLKFCLTPWCATLVRAGTMERSLPTGRYAGHTGGVRHVLALFAQGEPHGNCYRYRHPGLFCDPRAR